MTVLALAFALLALGLSGAAAFLALAARGDARSVGSGLARHRQSHAERSEERRVTARQAPPRPGEPSTEQLAAQPAQRPPLPRPGQIGAVTPVDWRDQP